VLLLEKFAWLGSDVVAWFRQFSQDSIQISPDEDLETCCMSDEELDVILCIYVISTYLCIYAMRVCL
jgi:hypothetical protein